MRAKTLLRIWVPVALFVTLCVAGAAVYVTVALVLSKLSTCPATPSVRWPTLAVFVQW